MTWFRNFYICPECGNEWEDEWSCMCDGDCPECCHRHISPEESDDLSVVVEQLGTGRYAIRYSPPNAEHKANYQEFAEVSDKRVAAFLAEIVTPLTGHGSSANGDFVDED
jgi:hypothetical protein